MRTIHDKSPYRQPQGRSAEPTCIGSSTDCIAKEETKTGRVYSALSTLADCGHRGLHADDGSGGTASERLLTVGELAKLFNVSAKTIFRWRNAGLAGHPLVVDGKTRVGFLQSSVEQFVRDNPRRVRRASQFCRLSPTQREQIVDTANELVGNGHLPDEVLTLLAEQTGHGRQVIRYTIRQHDRKNPEQAVFISARQTLSDEARQAIYKQFRWGASPLAIATRYGRPQATIKRVIQQQRAERIGRLDLQYMPSPEFDPEAEARILAPIPAATKPRRKCRPPTELPSYLASLYDTPLLTAEQELHQFRKYNYLKFLASGLREQLDPHRPRIRVMDRIEYLVEQSVATKNQILQANLRLVVSIAKRYASSSDRFYELISEGNVSLMRAADKFDYRRGFKFSTYATWAIKRNFARNYTTEVQRQGRFRTSHEEVLSDHPEGRANPHEEEKLQRDRKANIETILNHLNQRERRIVERHFGLTPGEPPKTLKELGTEFGVSKERVRQIEVGAMIKLREAAQAAQIEV